MSKLIFLFLLLICQLPCYAAYTELKSFPFGTNKIVRDDKRDRIYCTVPTINSVAVIDSESLQVLATVFTGSQPSCLATSPDGTRLYVANYGTTTQGIAILDLNTLTVSGYIATSAPVYDLVVSATTLYTIEDSSLRAYSATSRAALPGVISGYPQQLFITPGSLGISKDGSVVFFQSFYTPAYWYRIGVTSWPGTKLQTGNAGNVSSGIITSADGQWLTFLTGVPSSLEKRPANDPSTTVGRFNTGYYARTAAYSPNGGTLFTNHPPNQIDLWDTSTFLKTGTITTDSAEIRPMACDRKGKVLFGGTGNAVRAYLIEGNSPADQLDVEVKRAVEIRWDSIYGQLYQVQWVSLLDAAGWQPLGGRILGTGLTMSAFDTTRNFPLKFYRVLPVN